MIAVTENNNKQSVDAKMLAGDTTVPLREQCMIGDKTLVEAFSDPSRVPLTTALQLIEMAVANRPDAKELRETLAARFIKQNGITMYGTAITDATVGQAHDPVSNPGILYVSPYDRPTAGAHTFVTYQDGNGEIYVALVKNWKDPRDHSKGVEVDWRFSGGYMNIGQDANLQLAAARELEEETGIKQNSKQLPEILFVDSERHAFDKTHSIVANCYLDLGRHNEAPPVLAGDDVATARWINIRQLQHISSPPSFSGHKLVQVMVDGKLEPFRLTHTALLEQGIAKTREKLLLQHAGATTPAREPMHQTAPEMAQNFTINIDLPALATASPPSSWRERLQTQESQGAVLALN